MCNLLPKRQIKWWESNVFVKTVKRKETKVCCLKSRRSVLATRQSTKKCIIIIIIILSQKKNMIQIQISSRLRLHYISYFLSHLLLLFFFCSHFFAVIFLASATTMLTMTWLLSYFLLNCLTSSWFTFMINFLWWDDACILEAWPSLSLWK